MNSPIKLLLLFCCCFFQLSTHAQNFDSLKVELAKATLEDSPQQFTILKEITSAYSYANLDSALYYANIMVQGAENTGDQLTLAKSYNTLSDIYNIQGLYKEAILPLEKSIEICKELKSVKGLTVNKYLKGNILQNLQQYKNSNKFYLESLDLAIENNDSMMMTKNIQGLGINSEYMGAMDEAIQYYFEAINISSDINDQYGLADIYTNIGNVYDNNKQFDKAISYYHKAIKIKKEFKNYAGLTMTYYNLIVVYLDQNNLAAAESFIDSTLHYGRISNSLRLVAYAHKAQGSIYSRKGELDKALKTYQKAILNAEKLEDPQLTSLVNEQLAILYNEKGMYVKAQSLFEKTIRYFQDVGNLELENKIQLNYIKLLKEKGEYKKATDAYRRVLLIKDSLFTQQTITAINEIDTKYQTEKKEIENQTLKSKSYTQATIIQSQRTTLIGSVFGIGLLALVAFLFYRQNQRQKKTNQLLADKKEKIEILHRELSHRVKNNLTFISGLMQLQGARLENKEAKRAVKEGGNRIEAISLLHRKLYLEEDANINIGTYLEELCENLRNTYPFETAAPNIKLETDDIETDGETAVRIGLIINELVTNSFKYAFAEQPDPNIEIQLKKKDETMYQLKYQDNGQGLPSGIDVAQINSFGLKLIQMLTKQLNGTLNMKNEEGAHFKIDFTNPNISIK